MNTLYIKLMLMPSVIAFVTLIGRKWGNNVAGIIGSLPWVAGPIILFIAIERGINFATSTIPGVMVGIVGWLVFCFIYMIVGKTQNAFVSVMIGYMAYIIVGIILNPYIQYLSTFQWFLISLILLLVGLLYFPKVEASEAFYTRKLKFEIPLRMLMITMFVIGITYFAEILGPNWSGILTPFPIMTAVLAIFTHYTQGIFQVRKIYMGLFTGMLGFSLFLFVQAYFMPVYGIAISFITGIILDVILTLIMKKVFNYFKLN